MTMAKGKWIVAAVACAGLLGCQTTGPQGPGSPYSVPYVCKKSESPCRIDTFVDWIVMLFPRASVKYEKLAFEAGNKGDVLWVLPGNDLYFKDGDIAFSSLDGGDKVFKCGLVNPQNGESQQMLCSLVNPPATGEGKDYKYTIAIHYKGWYFIWPHDPWVIN